jgi:endonuclease/exonuclease/phosphatase family metal-dependent hydrolase
MAQLKLVSYNIDNSTQTDQIVKNIFELAKSGVNIFCLQEVRPSKSGEFIGKSLLDKLGSGWEGEFFLTTKPNNCDYGLGILWNSVYLKPVKFDTLSFFKLLQLDFHEQIFGLLRGEEITPIQRGSLIGTFKFDDRVIRISNVHMDWHGWVGHRTRQLQELLDFLKQKSATDAEIICGDFNSLGFFGYGQRLEKIKNILGSEFVNSFPEFRNTTTHYQHLDQIFVKNLKIHETDVLELPGSDHYPIQATISF